MKAFETKIKDLSELQRSHLAWRLDNKTYCGMVTATHIANLKWNGGNNALLEIFTEFDCSERAAKIHSKKVIDFKLFPKFDENGRFGKIKNLIYGE